MQALKKDTLRALLLVVVMTIVCGLAFPLLMTGVSQLLFRDKANGSIIEVDGKKYGSSLLAQEFAGDEYLWGRVMNANASAFLLDESGNVVIAADGITGEPLYYSGPSNKSPASEEYERRITERVERIEAAHPEKQGQPIPADLVTCSGSGLDPHISPDAAEYQVARVANARGMSEDEVRAVIENYTDGRFLGIFGEPTVNVLKVNLALDGILK